MILHDHSDIALHRVPGRDGILIDIILLRTGIGDWHRIRPQKRRDAQLPLRNVELVLVDKDARVDDARTAPIVLKAHLVEVADHGVTI